MSACRGKCSLKLQVAVVAGLANGGEMQAKHNKHWFEQDRPKASS
jgi:hypothetical protein